MHYIIDGRIDLDRFGWMSMSRWLDDVGAEANADSLVNQNWIRTEVEDELKKHERLVYHPEI